MGMFEMREEHHRVKAKGPSIFLAVLLALEINSQMLADISKNQHIVNS